MVRQPMAAAALLAAFVAAALKAQPPFIQNRLILASQSDFGAKRGFYLDLECNGKSGRPCRLADEKLILGIADGQSWRFPTCSGPWQRNHDYRVRAVIGPAEDSLFLDSKLVARSAGAFSPQSGPVQVFLRPDWASAPADFLVQQHTVAIADSGGASLSRGLRPAGPLVPGVLIFQPDQPELLHWATRPGKTLTLEVTIRFTDSPDAATLAPLIDRFGQNRYAMWPGKVKSDRDLAAQWSYERAHRLPARLPGLDSFGGSTRLGWRSRATGYYRIERRSGYWWLITPTGYPCFYTGVCSAPQIDFDGTPVTNRRRLFAWLPGKTDPRFASGWHHDPWGQNEAANYFAFQAADMARRYGAGWRGTGTQLAIDRIREWGFCGAAKWTGYLKDLPVIPVLSHRGVPNVARHPDIFDPAIRLALSAALREQIEPHKSDPYVVGWSIGNEYDEIVTRAEVRQILANAGASAAKKALIEHVLDTTYHGDVARLKTTWREAGETIAAIEATPVTAAPEPDVEAMRRFYACSYYGFLYRAVKSIDANHLYFGFWVVPGWWQNESDWAMDAAACDVIGYDRYAESFADAAFTRLIASSGKPVLCGEFSYPPSYDGARGFGVYGVFSQNEADAGRLYTACVVDAARNPFCVGMCWFEYRDEPLTGRGPGFGPDLIYGEHYAFGLVDVTDTPKWPMVRAMRLANARLSRVRADASEGAVR